MVTNDIYTREDAEFLERNGVLPPDRIRAVETGCCPHTAIRDDIAANLDAVLSLAEAWPGLGLVLLESGGDNLTATFSPALLDAQSSWSTSPAATRSPARGGPGVLRSDLLVVNKTDLAPLVGADLGVMRADAERVRAGAPVVFLSLVEDPGAGPVVDAVTGWVTGAGGA